MLKRKLATWLCILWGIAILYTMFLGFSAMSEVPKLEGNVRALELQVQKEQVSNDTLRKQLADQETKTNQQAKQDQVKIAQLQKSLNRANAQIKHYKEILPVIPLSGRSEDFTSIMLSKASFTVTYYNLNGRTASGRHTTNDVTIAVDPRVIPIGSIVRLTFPDGHSEIRRADDTGGAIKGFRIDEYKDASTGYCDKLGVDKGVKIEIIGHI